MFPACRGILENDRFVFSKGELQGIAGDDRRILDLGDPEKPINFVPQDVMDDEGEELIPERPLQDARPGYNPELGYAPERGFRGPGSDSVCSF